LPPPSDGLYARCAAGKTDITKLMVIEICESTPGPSTAHPAPKGQMHGHYRVNHEEKDVVTLR
jgi:hypothetical protein